MMRHLALQRGSLRLAPWRSSSVANPPSIRAWPPHRLRKSSMNGGASSAASPMSSTPRGREEEEGGGEQGRWDSACGREPRNVVAPLLLLLLRAHRRQSTLAREKLTAMADSERPGQRRAIYRGRWGGR